MAASTRASRSSGVAADAAKVVDMAAATATRRSFWKDNIGISGSGSLAGCGGAGGRQPAKFPKTDGEHRHDQQCDEGVRKQAIAFRNQVDQTDGGGGVHRNEHQ